MHSKYPEYHTTDLTRTLIFSDWTVWGIKAKYIKFIIILGFFLIALTVKQILFPETNSSPFPLMYAVVMVSTLLAGLRAGLIITAIAVLVAYARPYFLHLSPIDNRIVMVFIFQSILYSIIIETIIGVLRKLRRQADLLSLSNEAIIVINVKDNIVLYWNYGAENMYKYAKEEALNKNVSELLRTESDIPLEEIHKKVIKEGKWDGELMHCKKDGKQIIVKSNWICKKDDDGNPSIIVELNTDITKQKILETRRDDFLSIASHELKTPVTSIKAFTQILESRSKKKGDTATQSFLSKMDTQINRLTSLVNDLLDSTRIQSGKLQLNLELFRINDLVDEVIENMQLTTEKHSIQKQGKIRELVWADRNRTEQVLINLINNAIKYSPRSDKVIVHLSEQNDFVKIGVEDRGIGIPKEKVKRIFDRFYRVESKKGEFTGLGLGLYISSEIVKRQKGHMWVESEEKIGSTFFFTLPTRKEGV